MTQEKNAWKRHKFGASVKLKCDPVCDAQVTNIQEEHILAINDCRDDINTLRTRADRVRENVYFEEFERNRWPYIAVITSRNIDKGEEICVHYGFDYSHQIPSDEEYTWEDACRWFSALTDIHSRSGSHNVAKS